MQTPCSGHPIPGDLGYTASPIYWGTYKNDTQKQYMQPLPKHWSDVQESTQLMTSDLQILMHRPADSASP